MVNANRMLVGLNDDIIDANDSPVYMENILKLIPNRSNHILMNDDPVNVNRTPSKFTVTNRIPLKRKVINLTTCELAGKFGAHPPVDEYPKSHGLCMYLSV